MKITFLGTGTSQGVPIIACDCDVCRSADFRDKRLRTSIHIQTDDGQSLIVDAGPDFRAQVLRERITRLDAVLFTHAHKDHTAGLDDIRGFYFAQGMQPMPLYLASPVLEQLKMEYSYFFAEDKYPGVPSVEVNTISKEVPFSIGGTEIVPIEVMHGKMPILGFRLGSFTYITDANHIAPDMIERIKGTETLVLNALHHKKHYSHYTLQEALEVVEQVQPKRTFLTHISHNMGIHKDVDEQLPEGVFLAYDGLQLTVDS